MRPHPGADITKSHFVISPGAARDHDPALLCSLWRLLYYNCGRLRGSRGVCLNGLCVRFGEGIRGVYVVQEFRAIGVLVGCSWAEPVHVDRGFWLLRWVFGTVWRRTCAREQTPETPYRFAAAGLATVAVMGTVPMSPSRAIV